MNLKKIIADIIDIPLSSISESPNEYYYIIEDEYLTDNDIENLENDGFEVDVSDTPFGYCTLNLNNKIFTMIYCREYMNQNLSEIDSRPY